VKAVRLVREHVEATARANLAALAAREAEVRSDPIA
jgi:hypothetical protein